MKNQGNDSLQLGGLFFFFILFLAFQHVLVMEFLKSVNTFYTQKCYFSS